MFCREVRMFIGWDGWIDEEGREREREDLFRVMMLLLLVIRLCHHHDDCEYECVYL